MVGKVESYLLEEIRKSGAIHLSLIDPEKVVPEAAADMAGGLEEEGTAGIMVGSSTMVSVYQLDEVIRAIKGRVKVPVILFPNDLTGISKHADAIFFMSLLNSSNPYYITGAQALGAPTVKLHGLEPIPMGYIIVGEGGAAGFIGQAKPIPMERPEIAALYALAAQYLGMRFVYLEAGSGARKPVTPRMVNAVRSLVDIPIVVGGGIRTPLLASRLIHAGASAVVTGTVLEVSSKRRIRQIIRSVGEAGKRRSLAVERGQLSQS